MKPKLIFFLLFTFNLLLAATATIRYVSKTGSATPPYTSWATASDSIQKCVNFAVAGDTIYVANGVFKEKIIIQKSLTVIGNGIDSCIIDTRELVTPTNFEAVYIGGRDILFKNFWIIVSTNHVGMGIYNSYTGSETIIEYNKIERAQYGMEVFNSHAIVRNNIIRDVNKGIRLGAFTANYFPVIDSNIIVTVYDFSHGISCSFGTSSTIRNNYVISEGGGDGYYLILNPLEIRNNVAVTKIDYGNDEFYFSLGSGIIANNHSIGKTGSQGMELFRGRNTVRNNNIMRGEIGYKIELPDVINFRYNNAWGVGTPFSGFAPDSTNLIVDPMLVNEDSLDFHLQMYSPLIDAGDPTILDRDGSRSDIGLFGGPYGEKYTYRDLAPKPPKNLTAQMENGFVRLRWNKNTEADFSYYRIYRDTVPHFIYDTTKIVGVTSDTTYLDHLPITTSSKKYYYLLTAMDSTNHQSAPSEEVMVMVTGLNEIPPIVVVEYKLLNNYPNPFNASTLIPYRLKEGGYVKLIIYNVMGEVVRVLVNEFQPSGYYEAEFRPNISERKMGETGVEYPTGYNDDIASGLYIYSLNVRGEGDITVFTSMGKMILLK